MEHEGLTVTVDAGDGGAPKTVVLPEGWTKSPNRNTSRYAMGVSSGRHGWRGVYFNDGRGNGYFAPGWNGRRLARNMRTLQRAAAAVTVAVLVFFIGWTGWEIRDNAEYYRLADEGVSTQAVVRSVEVERTRNVKRKGRGERYNTDTTATVTYGMNGSTHEAVLEHSASGSTDYPEPEWAEGEQVAVYADPQDPQNIRAVSSFLEERDSPINSTFWLIAAAGVALTGIPALIFCVARSSRRKAEAL